MQTGQVRTTVYLNEALYIEAKKKAIEERSTLTDLIQDGLKKRITEVSAEISHERQYKDILKLRGVFKTKKKIPFRKIREAFGDYLARRHLNSL